MLGVCVLRWPQIVLMFSILNLNIAHTSERFSTVAVATVAVFILFAVHAVELNLSTCLSSYISNGISTNEFLEDWHPNKTRNKCFFTCCVHCCSHTSAPILLLPLSLSIHFCVLIPKSIAENAYTLLLFVVNAKYAVMLQHTT